jgi:hypothetical protein
MNSTDHPPLLGSVQQGLHERVRLDPKFVEHRGTGHALHHQVAEALVGGNERAGLVEVGGERNPRVVDPHCPVQDPLERLAGPGEDRLVQPLAGREVSVQGGVAHPGPARDLVERSVQALFAQYLAGGVDQPLPVARRVSPQP